MEVGKEITKEQVLELPEGTEFVIYNPLTDTYKFEKSGKNDTAHNKYVYEKLVFFEAVKGNEKENEDNE